MMKKGLRLWIVLAAFIPIAAWGTPLDYESRQSARPLTIPDGMFEVGYGLKPDASTSGWSSLNPFFLFRYGITDNLEFIPLGLKYRFLNDSAGNTEATIEFLIPGFGYSTYSSSGGSGSTTVNATSYAIKTSAKGEIKHKMLDGDLALHGMIHSFNQQRYGDATGLGPMDIAYVYEGGGGITYSFLPRASITFDANYQKINGAEIVNVASLPTNIATETVEVVLGVLGLEYNTSRFDLRAEYFYGSGTRSFHSSYNYAGCGKYGYSAIAIVRF